MKKIAMVLAMTSCLGLFSCGPANTNPAGSNPNGTTTGTNPNGTTGGTQTGGFINANGSFTTKTDFIKYAQCLKANPATNAEQKGILEGWINVLNPLPEAQWPAINPIYTSYIKVFAVAGCN